MRALPYGRPDTRKRKQPAANFDSINRLVKQTERIQVRIKVLVIVQYLEPDRHNHDEVQFSTAIRQQILTFPVVENLFCRI